VHTTERILAVWRTKKNLILQGPPGVGKTFAAHLIIDTKYYAETLQVHHGKSSLRSENLYQLFSYLKNSEALGPAYRSAEGILLYPAVGDNIAFKADIQGHCVRICTVNLDQPWQKIRSDLLGLLKLEHSESTKPRI
jgi:5-methylcytosine-specific restriction enzyme subunit McrC